MWASNISVGGISPPADRCAASALDLRADQPEPLADAVDVRVHRQGRPAEREQQHAGGRLRADAAKRGQVGPRLFQRQIARKSRRSSPRSAWIASSTALIRGALTCASPPERIASAIAGVGAARCRPSRRTAPRGWRTPARCSRPTCSATGSSGSARRAGHRSAGLRRAVVAARKRSDDEGRVFGRVGRFHVSRSSRRA